MGPATPSRLALNEASWSGTARSARYKWTSEPAARDRPGFPPLARTTSTQIPLVRLPHTSRAEWFIREVTRVLAGERCRAGGVDGVGGDVSSGRGDDGRSSRQLLAQPHWRHPPISRSVARPAPVSAVSSTTARSG